MPDIELFDTTLRDGCQGEEVVFSVEEKLQIARALDSLGIHYIEGGYPGSNPKDVEFFQRVKNEKFAISQVVPFGSTAHPKFSVESDPNLQALLATELPTIVIVGKTWTLHVEAVLQISREENLKLIEDSVRFLTKNNRKVIYDGEHTFDGYKADPQYALDTFKAAQAGGAERLVMCDTNGGTLPLEVYEIVQHAKKELSTPIGIHTHDDSGVATANALLAVQAGATHVQGTFNGYGERCGNLNLSNIIPTLKLKLGLDCISDERLKKLTGVSRLISELANLPHNERQAYVGKSAFAHKGGLHIDGIRKDRRTFEHIDPLLVGNEQRILISEQSGRSAILMKTNEDFDKNSLEAQKIFEALKEAEQKGYQYEAAEASFQLLTSKILGQHSSSFEIQDFKVTVSQEETEASVKINASGEEVQISAKGNGPLNSIEKVLHSAIEKHHPELAKVHMANFKIRVLDSKKGTQTKIRVLMESTDGEETWGTVGVSGNIVIAFLEALLDSLEYKLHKQQMLVSK